MLRNAIPVGIFGYLLAIVSDLPAQTLPEVTVSAGHPTGHLLWEADTLPSEAPVTLADRLLWEHPLAVRANAPGTLTTVSARGAGPGRTAVMWHGLNLQSPQNGVVDVSLIPLWPGDRLQIVPGGQSSALGNGAMGGVLTLVSPDHHPRGLSGDLGFSAGSFGFWQAQARTTWSDAHVSSTLKGLVQTAENNFPFVNTAQIGQPEQKQTNNSVRRIDWQQHNTWQFNAHHSLETALWWQEARREIPPSMTASADDTWQKDRNFRAAVSWKPTENQQHRLAWSDENIHFFLNGDTDTSRARTAQWQTRLQTPEGRPWRFVLEAQLTPQWGRADGYTDSSRWYAQWRGALAPAGSFRWKSGKVSLTFRQEWTDFAEVPLLWAAAAEQALGNRWRAHLHFSRNFNLPTLNDRFWLNLGNPDLAPEQGYSAEAGIRWAKKELLVGGTVFHLLLDDWILWQPGSDGVFRPGNLRQVWSRGVEMAASWEKRAGAWRLSVQAHAQFSATTNTKVYGGTDVVLDKQLIYTPAQLAGGSFTVHRGPFSVAYLHQYSGARYTRSDESGQLPAYQTGTAMVRYQFPVGRWNASVEGRLENCWNVSYQIIEYRPMPGRSGRIGLLAAF